MNFFNDYIMFNLLFAENVGRRPGLVGGLRNRPPQRPPPVVTVGMKYELICSEWSKNIYV